MTENNLIQEMIKRILNVYAPYKIILFGSRARDKARKSSDYDILLIMDSDKPRYLRCAPLYTELADLPAEVELVAYTPEEVKEWSAVPAAFITTALREGKVLYEKS